MITSSSTTGSRTQMIQFTLLGLYVAVLVAANAAGSKIIAVGQLAASATVFAYAISFLVTDIASEIYGRKTANQFVIVGFFGVVLAVIFFRVAFIARPAEFYTDQGAFEAVFRTSPRLLAGGFIAYLVSQFFDIAIFHKIRAATKGRFMWLRNNGSTMISQFIDSIIFIFVAFYGVVDDIMALVLGQYLIKMGIAIADTPIMYGLVALIRRSDPSVNKAEILDTINH